MTFNWPVYSEKEICDVKETLESGNVNYWTGKKCREFEREFALFTGSKFAISLANGSLALDLSLRALGIKKGDEVIVTSRTYIATVSSIVNIGAKPVFVDVDIDTQNIDVSQIESSITDKTKLILCVHLAGWPCDMDEIMNIATKNNLFVLEDCAQAHGAKYKGRSVGSIGHIGAWSFCQDKIISTGGEGGMVTTNDRKLWKKMWSFKDHGKSYDLMHEEYDTKSFRWVHSSFGSNYRMTEIQAVIGIHQLKKINKWNKIRRENLLKIYSAIENLSIVRIPKMKCGSCNGGCNHSCNHAAYKCYVFIRGNEKLRDKILLEINESGVPCFAGTCSEVYLESAFDSKDFRPKERLSNARKLGETSLMFLIHPTLSEADLLKTCQVIKEVIVKNT